MANRKGTRRSNVGKQRQRQRQRQSMRQRRRHGGAAVSLGMAAGLDAAYKPLEGSSLQQGQQAMELAKQTGGAADYPAALSGAPLIDGSMASSARTAVLDRAMSEIQGMSDQAGGRRRRRNASCKKRKAPRSTRRKASRSTRRKASRKGRKARKASRQSQRQSQRQRQRQRQGGGGFTLAPADFSKEGDGMLGINPQVAGLHKEWADVAAAGGGDYMAPSIQQTYRSDENRA